MTERTAWWEMLVEGTRNPEAAGVPAFIHELGIVVSKVEPGEVTVDWTPPPMTRTPAGWVQGGFLGVPLDFAQTVALMTQLPEPSMAQTLEQKVSFIDVPFAERFVVVGRALRWGKRAGHTDGEIREPGGKLIATTTATQVIRQLSPEQAEVMRQANQP